MTKAEAIKTRAHKSIKKYPDVLTGVDLQQILSIGEYAAYKLIREGDIYAVTIGNTYRIPKLAVENYLRGGVVA